MRNYTRLRNRGRRMLAFGSAPAAAWTPALLTSLAAWYTAGPTWCFTDAGGTAACGDGDLVRVWKDRSGVGTAGDLTQGTSANRPTLVLGVDGRWLVRFDGVNDSMLAANSFTRTQPHGLWMAAANATDSGYYLDGGSLNTAVVQRFGATTLRLYAGTVGDVTTVDLTNRASVVANFAGAASLAALNGAETVTDAGTGSASGLRVGIGGNGVTSPSAMDLCELALASAAIGASDRALLLTYSRATWGTP